MTTLNKVHSTSVYDDYGITGSDDDDEIIKNVIRPSELSKPIPSNKNKKIHSDMNSDTGSDTDSDDYNENNNIIEVGRRRHSFIRNSLKKLTSRINVLPEHVKQTLIDTDSINSPNNSSYFNIFKRKTLLGLSIISGTIISLIVIL
tara:strand:- start:10 stop:447 length:438 start_codon:yes stop_codon:yes gene_type:complete